MASSASLIRAADALAGEVHARIDSQPFFAFRDRLVRLRLDLVAGRDAFAATDRDGPDGVLADLDNAGAAVAAMTPADASVDGAELAVDRAIGSLRAATDTLHVAAEAARRRGSSEAPATATRISGLRGALRLERPSLASARRAGVDDETVSPPVQGGGGDPNYYNKLISLFPAEALALYGTGVAVFSRSTLAALLVCLGVLVLLRWVANQPPGGGRTHVAAVFVAAVAFLLWTTATDPDWLTDLLGALPATASDAVKAARTALLASVQKWAAFLGAAWVLIAPLFVHAQPAQPTPT